MVESIKSFNSIKVPSIVLFCMARARLSAYINLRVVVSNRSPVYRLNKKGAKIKPYGRPFFYCLKLTAFFVHFYCSTCCV